MIVSDHGFGPVDRAIYVNSILEKYGCLKTDQASQTPAGKFGFGLGLAPRAIVSLLIRPDCLNVHRWIVGDLRKKIRSSIEGYLTPRIDWSRTVAYTRSHSSWGVFMDPKGPNPKGVVEPDDYEKIGDEAISTLSSLRDPDTGQLAFQTVAKGEDMYGGRYIGRAPDIIAIPWIVAFSYLLLATNWWIGSQKS